MLCSRTRACSGAHHMHTEQAVQLEAPKRPETRAFPCFILTRAPAQLDPRCHSCFAFCWLTSWLRTSHTSARGAPAHHKPQEFVQAPGLPETGPKAHRQICLHHRRKRKDEYQYNLSWGLRRLSFSMHLSHKPACMQTQIHSAIHSALLCAQ